MKKDFTKSQISHNMGKKILKIVNSNDSGGVFTSEQQYLRLFKQNNYEVDLIIIGKQTVNSTIYESLCNKYNYYDIKLDDFSGKGLKGIKDVFKLEKDSSQIVNSFIATTQKLSYKAIIFRRANYLFIAGKLSKYMNIQAYWHMPNAISSKLKMHLYRIFHKFYRIKPVANSKYTLKTYSSRCKDIIYPGFDMERIEGGSDKFKIELGIPSEVPVYGNISRICYDKAQDILISAFLASEAYLNNAHLIIAGNFEDEDFHKKLFDLVKGKERIHFVGKVTKVNDFYKSIDVLINSRRNVEAFGISIAEAMASQKPVVAYKLGGPSELIKHKETGWLIDQPTIQDYKKWIDVSFSQRKNWSLMGERAKSESVKYSAQYNVKKFIDLIESDTI